MSCPSALYSTKGNDVFLLFLLWRVSQKPIFIIQGLSGKIHLGGQFGVVWRDFKVNMRRAGPEPIDRD